MVMAGNETERKYEADSRWSWMRDARCGEGVVEVSKRKKRM